MCWGYRHVLGIQDVQSLRVLACAGGHGDVWSLRAPGCDGESGGVQSLRAPACAGVYLDLLGDPAVLRACGQWDVLADAEVWSTPGMCWRIQRCVALLGCAWGYWDVLGDAEMCGTPGMCWGIQSCVAPLGCAVDGGHGCLGEQRWEYLGAPGPWLCWRPAGSELCEQLAASWSPIRGWQAGEGTDVWDSEGLWKSP